MSSLDAPLRAAALQLIAKFGTPIALRSVDPGEYDTSTRKTALRVTDRIVKGLPEKYKARFGATHSDGVQTGGLQFTIAAQGLEDWPLTRNPRPTDRLIVGFRNLGTESAPVLAPGVGTEYTVTHADPVYSGDLPALFVLHVAR